MQQKFSHLTNPTWSREGHFDKTPNLQAGQTVELLLGSRHHFGMNWKNVSSGLLGANHTPFQSIRTFFRTSQACSTTT
jgi:hypothetical protein